MSDAYPNQSLKPADLYYLKDNVAVEADDLLVLTGSLVNGLLEVDKMSATYTNDKVVGATPLAMAADYPDRHITITVKGPVTIKAAKAITGGQNIMGFTGAAITELFDGDATALQTLYVGNVPIGTVTSFTEDPSGTPTVLTRVTTKTPSADQYYLDDDTGELIIGGTSVSGTDNYELIYTINGGRIEPHIEWVEETLTVSTNVGTLTHIPEEIEYVEATAGSVTGNCGIITAGTVATKEVKVDRAAKTLTFFATDAVTECKVRYKTAYKKCGFALGSAAIGELCKVYLHGGL